MTDTVIVCVDDEEFILRSLKRELNAALGDRYFIETADGGEDALQIVEELLEDGHDIPVVISDHIMMDMNGDELLQRIHDIVPQTLTIMLTGQADMNAVTNAVNQANLYRYIAKPWENTDLILTVKEAIHTYFQEKKLEKQHRTLQDLYAQAKQEITERKRVEAALREREARIRAIVETAADGIMTIDEEGLIQSFNSAAERMFDYQANDVIGQHIRLLMENHPQFVDAQQQYNSTHLQQYASHAELTGKRKNGEVFPVDLATSEVCLEQQRIFIDILRDISKWKQAERERLKLSAIERELSIACEIQQSLLPDPQPDWGEVELMCYTAPAREVGGDFYSYSTNCNTSQKRKFVLSIGDVSGKGVSAALLMASVLSLFDASHSFAFTPAERLAYLDRAIVPYTRKRAQNCALCYVEFELPGVDASEQGIVTLRTVNAGGIPPYIKRVNGSIEWLDARGLPLGLGIGAETGYQEICLNLSVGDMIILVSDGVVEANNAANEMFGFERLESAIVTSSADSAEGMLEQVTQELTHFVGDTEAYDDMTMMVVKI